MKSNSAATVENITQNTESVVQAAIASSQDGGNIMGVMFFVFVVVSVVVFILNKRRGHAVDSVPKIKHDHFEDGESIDSLDLDKRLDISVIHTD